MPYKKIIPAAVILFGSHSVLAADAPVVTVDFLITNDQRPALTGTVSSNGATITVDVGGQTNLLATNNGDGTWTLLDNTINPALAENTYDVSVTADDGEVGVDGSTNELVIDLTAPVVTVNTLTTVDSSPSLTGTVSDNNATISVSVGAQSGLSAVNNGNGTWTLADNLISLPAVGIYSVTAQATDTAGNTGTDGSSNELTLRSPPEAGGDVTATDPAGGAVSIAENAGAPGSANIRITPITLSDADGSTPDSIRLLSIDGGSLAQGDGSAIFLGTSGTVLALTAGNLDLRFTPSPGRNTDATIDYVVVDPEGLSDSASSTITVSITASASPVASGAPSDVTVVEDTLSDIDFSMMTISDADSPSLTVTLTASSGTFAAPADGAGVGSGVTETLDSATVITLVGSPADISSYLDTASNLQYTTASNVSGDDVATITVVANEGDGSGDLMLATVNIDSTAVNDDPEVVGLPAAVTVSEDTQSNIDFSAASFSDADGDAITVTLTITLGSFATPGDGAGIGSGVDETLVNATTVTLTGAASDINAYLDTSSNLQYTAPSNLSGSAITSITVTGNDSAGSGDVSLAAVGIDVTAINDAPVFSGLDGTPTFTEDGAAVLLDSNVTVSDVELLALNGGNGNFAGASLSIERNGGRNMVDTFSIQTGGNLTVAGSNISAGGNVIASFDTSTAGRVTVTFQDNGTVPTNALVNEVMQAIRYANTSNDPAVSVQLDWTVGDGNSANAQGSGDNPGIGSGSTTVSITNINDAPTLTATGQNPTYTEGAGFVDLYSGPTADTVEMINTLDRFSAMTFTVTNVSDAANELLRIDGSDLALTDGNSIAGTATNGLAVSVSVTGTTATVSFSGATLTNAQMQTLVDSLVYANTSEHPTTSGNRVVTITGITDNGGTANGGQDSAAPNLSSTISLTAVNDPPVLGNIDGETSYITPGNPAAVIDGLGDATLGNEDSPDHNGGSLVIVDNGSNNTENGNWGVSGTVTSGGDGTIAAGETLQVDGFSIGTIDPSNDGQGGNTLEILFNANSTIARVETLIQNLTLQYPSGTGLQTFSLVINDADGTANGGDQDAIANFTVNLYPRPVIANLNGDSVSTTTNTVVAVDTGGDATVTWTASANLDDGYLTISRSALDGDFSLTGDGSTGLSSGINSGDADGIIALNEDIFWNGTAIATLSGGNTGQGSNDLIMHFSLAATPAIIEELIQDLHYSSSTPGIHTFTLTLESSAAYEAVSVPVSFTIQVEAVPVNTVPGAQSGVDGTVRAIAGVSVADADSASLTTTLAAANGIITVSTGGAAVVTSNNTGNVTITGSPAAVNAALAGLSYTPQTNSFGAQTLTINTTDGSYNDNDAITINVTDRPDVDNLSGTVEFAAGSAGVLLDAGADAQLTDADSTNFSGGTLTATISAGGVPAEDLLTLDTTGIVALAGSEANDDVLVDGTVIGTLGNAIAEGNDLLVNFNSNATATRISSLLQTLRYENVQTTSPTTGTRTVDLEIADGDGNAVVLSVSVSVIDSSSPGGGGDSGGGDSGGGDSGGGGNSSSGGGSSRQIAGDVQNTGTLRDVTIRSGSSVTGGALAGTINNGGTVHNVQLLPGTTVNGGTASGDIVGTDPEQPALLTNTQLTDAYLENVVIGSGTTLGENIVLGSGVRFASAGSIPSGLDLTGAFATTNFPDDPDLPPALDLSFRLIDDGSSDTETVLASIQNLDALQSFGVEIEQDPDSNEMLLRSGNSQAKLRPVAVIQAPAGTAPGVYFTEDGNVAVVNDQGQQVVSQPVLAEISTLRNDLGGFSLSQDGNGNLNFSGSDNNEKFVGRPALQVLPATRSSMPGLTTFIKDRPANVAGAVFAYEDENGQLQEQEIVPAPLDWPSLKSTLQSISGVESASIAPDGLLTIVLNGVVVEAVTDFQVNENSGAGSGAGVSFTPAGDINGDGIEDFRMTFANGDTQVIYILP